MSEYKGDINPNLQPDGKRRLSPRLGLKNPLARGMELLDQGQQRANEALDPLPAAGSTPVVQIDLPLDAGDRVEDLLQSLKK